MTHALDADTADVPATALVPLTAIDLDASRAYWPREQLDRERIGLLEDLYEHEPGIVPPIVLVPHPTKPGDYVLCDGTHRVIALGNMGKIEARAIIKPAGTDIYAEALLHTTAGPTPLTRPEKQAAVVRLLGEHPDWTNRHIARLAEVSHPTVASYRDGAGKSSSALNKRAGTAAASDPFTPAPSFPLAGQTTKDFKRVRAVNEGLFNLMYGEKGASESESKMVERWSDAINAQKDQEGGAQILVNFEHYSRALARIVEAARQKAAAADQEKAD